MSDDAAVELLAGLRTGDWLDRQDFPPLAWAVPGVAPEGMSLLIGPPKAGKSFLTLGVALAVASGGRALGAIATGGPRPTLYLALEDGDRRLQERCRSLLEGDPIPANFTYMTRIIPGTVVQTINAWLDSRADCSPLVILDTLGKVMPPSMPGESAYARDYRVGSALKRAADDHQGTALLVLHHDRKAASEDFVDSVSGTHGLAGAADTILALKRDRQATEATLSVTGRDVTEAEYGLTLDGLGWRLAGRSLQEAAASAATIRASQGVGDRSAAIVSFVAAHPDGVRASDVEREIGADSRRYLARLVDAGRLDRLGRGIYILPPSTPVPTVPVSQVSGTGTGQQEMGQRDGWDAPIEEAS